MLAPGYLLSPTNLPSPYRQASRESRFHGVLWLALILFAFVAATVLTATTGASPAVRGVAPRLIIVEVRVTEPAPGFIQNITVELTYPQGGNRVSIVPAGAEQLQRSGDSFTRQYPVPDTVRAMIGATLRVNTTDAANPTYVLTAQEMDFTSADSRDFRIRRDLRFVPLRIEAVEQETDRSGRTRTRPVAANVRIRMRVGDAYTNVAVMRPVNFAAGVANTYLPAGPGFIAIGTQLDVEGRLAAPQGFDLYSVTRVAVTATGAVTVRIVFLNWEAQVRAALLTALQNAGVEQATARRISGVMVLPDPGVAFAEWRVNTRYYLAWLWEGSYYIGLNASFNPTEPNGGDSLIHEWIHETLYQAGWNAPDPPNTRHNCEEPACVETLAYEEGLAHMLGSHLLTRILEPDTVLGHTTAPCWLDNPADRLRVLALTYRNQANANNPAHAVMQNPGSWVEGIWAGALLEMLQEMGINPERQSAEALRAMVTDLRAFCAATAGARRTPETFFAFRRQNTRNLIPRFEGRVIDQIALWYLITTRANVADIERLVPVALTVNGAASVKPNEPVRFTAAARAFHRLAETRTYNRITARLVEGTTILARDIALKPNVAGGYNLAADLRAAWNTPGDHRVRAEIWGDFIDGNQERIGTSDDVAVTVTKEAPADITIQIDPPSITLDPEAMQAFTATLTGTTNLEVQWVATDYQGQEHTAGTLTKTGPNTITYKAPSYPGTYTMKATSRADTKKSATATITVKPVAIEGGVVYGTKIEHLPCMWEIKTTCDNNRVAYSVFRTETSSKLILTQALPNNLTLDDVKDLPLAIVIEYEGLSAVDDRTNCPPSRISKSGGGGKIYYADRSGTGSALKLILSLMIDAASPKVSIYLEVTDNVARTPIYKWNYKRGDRWLLFGGELALCTKGGVDTGDAGKPYDAGTGGAKPPTAAPLYVSLKPDKTSVSFGEIINVRADVSGGRADTPADYKFAWQGEHAGAGAQVQFTSRKAGPHALAVTVTDKDGKTATANVTFTVGGPSVELVKLDPPGGAMVYGRKAHFRARLVGAQIKNYVYRWEPQEAVTFSNPEGAEGVANQTAADFKRAGKVRVWVSVLEGVEGAFNTIAESEPIELDVGPPILSIIFDPPVPFIGQETRAKIAIQDPLTADRIDFRWTPPANVMVLAESQDKREVTFLPKDAGPVTFNASARVPHYGDDLGDVTATLSAKAYDVKAILVGPAAETVEGAELVKKPAAIAASQGVIIRASINPPPAGKVRFVWYVNQDGFNQFVGENFGTQVVVRRNGVGACEIAVEAEDANGIKLGRGTTVFTVAISKEEIEAAKKAKAAADKIISAKTLERKGQLDEAIALADEAVLLDPSNVEAAQLAKKWKSDRAAILDKLETVKQLMADVRFVDAFRELVVAQNINYSYQPVVEMTTLLGDTQRKWDFAVRDGIGQVRDASSRREFKRALDLAARLRATLKIGVYEKQLKDEEAWAQKWEGEKEGKRQLLKAAEAKLRQYDYDGALKDFEAGFMNHNILWAMSDPEPNYYNQLRGEAIAKRNRINELMPNIRWTAETANAPTSTVELNIKNADDVLALQPNNAEARRLRDVLAARLKSKTSAGEIESLIKQGTALSSQKKYGEAIAIFNQAIAINPNSSEAYRGRGVARRDSEDYKGAMTDFTQALTLDPQNHRAYFGRGYVKEKNRDLRGAVADYTRAIELNTQYESAYLRRGYVREELKDPSGAIADYDKAITINPKHVIAHNNRGVAKEKTGDLRGAISDFEKAIALDPNYERARNNLARVKAKLGEGVKDEGGGDSAKPPTTNEAVIFSNGNIGGVANNPSQPTVFTINQAHRITLVQTYHWNYGRGQSVGSITLRRRDGTTYGPWPVTGSPGQGGVANAYWNCSPNLVIPAGTYTIVDSDAATWAQNSGSSGRGFSLVKGYPVAEKPVDKTPDTTTPNKQPAGSIVTAIFENRSSENVHLFAEGETMSPANRLAPGESRRVNVRLPADGRVKFYAGRNGQVLASKYWNGDTDNLNRFPRVTFERGGQLIILTGLR